MFKFLHSLKYNTYPERIEMKNRELVAYSCKEAFRMFRDRKFRELLKFSSAEKTEQDRFFNEMVVTNIVMAMLILDQAIAASDPGDRRDYLKALRGSIKKYYLEYLEKLGIPKQFVNIWEKLLHMRYDEYTESVLEWRKIFLEARPELARDKSINIFQALAFGLFEHLRRGQVEKKDPLYKEIQSFLVQVYKQQRKKIG